MEGGDEEVVTLPHFPRHRLAEPRLQRIAVLEIQVVDQPHGERDGEHREVDHVTAPGSPADG